MLPPTCKPGHRGVSTGSGLARDEPRRGAACCAALHAQQALPNATPCLPRPAHQHNAVVCCCGCQHGGRGRVPGIHVLGIGGEGVVGVWAVPHLWEHHQISTCNGSRMSIVKHSFESDLGLLRQGQLCECTTGGCPHLPRQPHQWRCAQSPGFPACRLQQTAGTEPP